MKKFNFFYFSLVGISILYLFLRLWNLNNLITFHLDQGLHLTEAYQLIQNHRITLIGPMVSSKIFAGRGFFIGPFYTYSLAILGLFCRWNPLNITICLIIFECISLLLFLIWLSKKYSHSAIIVLFLLVSSCPYLIEHSRFFWNPHFLIPLSFLFIYFLEKKKYFFSAIVWGLAFSFHYSAVLWAIPVLFYLVKNRQNFKNYFLFILGFLIGDLPWFIFELKHSFYNIQTMFLVFANTNKVGELTAHYFVFAFFAFFILLMLYLFQKSPKIFYLISILIFLFNIFYKLNLQESIPIGMPKGWNYSTQKQVKQIIIQDGCLNNFNVAATINGDSQAQDIRYLLTIDNCIPDSIDSYPKDKTLFLIAPPDRLPQSEAIWEVSSFKPFNITKTVKINQDIYLYRLDK